jgi:hypothetical protein
MQVSVSVYSVQQTVDSQVCTVRFSINSIVEKRAMF